MKPLNCDYRFAISGTKMMMFLPKTGHTGEIIDSQKGADAPGDFVGTETKVLVFDREAIVTQRIAIVVQFFSPPDPSFHPLFGNALAVFDLLKHQ